MPWVTPGATCPVAPGTSYFRLTLNTGDPGDDRFYIVDTQTAGSITFSSSTASWAALGTTTTQAVASPYRGNYITYTWNADTVNPMHRETLPGDGDGVWAARSAGEAARLERNRARAIERREEQRAAQARAMILLKSLLTPEQVTQLDSCNAFHVPLPSGNVYEIAVDSSVGNVHLIGERGERLARYCAHPQDVDRLPLADTAVAQLLMLQSNETEFLRVANCHWDNRLGPPQRSAIWRQRTETYETPPTVPAPHPMVDPVVVDIGLGTVEDLDTGAVVPVTEEFVDADLDAERERLDRVEQQLTEMAERIIDRVGRQTLAS